VTQAQIARPGLRQLAAHVDNRQVGIDFAADWLGDTL
jgi:hypothetical protein